MANGPTISESNLEVAFALVFSKEFLRKNHSSNSSFVFSGCSYTHSVLCPTILSKSLDHLDHFHSIISKMVII